MISAKWIQFETTTAELLLETNELKSAWVGNILMHHDQLAYWLSRCYTRETVFLSTSEIRMNFLVKQSWGMAWGSLLKLNY